MTKLSVNVNKIASLRNARGGNNPNLIQVVKDCESYGAEGITVHPRPCLLYTSPSPRDVEESRMPSSA